MLRHRTFGLVIVAVLGCLVACGGGGSSDPINDGGGSSLISASFTPTTPNPGADMVTLQSGAVNANNVVVEVRITDVSGVFGASFDVLYNSTQGAYLGFTAGDALSGGGNTPLYDVQQPTPGRLVVFATRQGAGASGVDVTGTKTLIKLTFRVDRAGSSAMSFQNGELLDDQVQPQPIPGIAWSGGTLVGV